MHSPRTSLWQWFLKHHPFHYSAVALMLAVMALGIAVVTTVFAESTISTSTDLHTSSTDTMQLTETQDCSYDYSDWSACQSDGKRYRTVSSVSPSNCAQKDEPNIEESCQYTAPQTTSTVQVQCSYSYSEWGKCQSDGTRIRKFLSKSPSECEEYVKPVLKQSCVYDADSQTTTNTATTPSSFSESTESVSSVSPTVNNITPAFSFVNVDNGMTIRGNIEITGMVSGAKEVTYYLVPSGSNTSKYVGGGLRISEKIWTLPFHSAKFPNGEFYLRVKVKNAYGEYGGGQRTVHIDNNAVTSSASVSGATGPILLSQDTESARNALREIEQDLGMPEYMSADSKNTEEINDQKRKRIFDYCESNQQVCASHRDSDNDGLNDIDEVRYGTDPKSADSDLDGYIDGDEIKNGFDPSKYSAGDKSDRIIFEDPKLFGEVQKDVYAVQTIEVKEHEKTGKKTLRLSGKGLPNSFITLYIYSDPIILTVKTDKDGNWIYDLDKELEDGTHQAYVAVTDNTGKITAKSEPIAFVKTAQAATIIPLAGAVSSSETLPVVRDRTEKDILFLVAIIISALAIALSALGFVVHRRAGRKEELLQL